MANTRTLDMEYVHSQFPALSNGWAFFDNAGGSQILTKALDRINSFLLNRNVQIGGSYEVSKLAAEALLDARKSAAQLVPARGNHFRCFDHRSFAKPCARHAQPVFRRR